MRCAVCSARRGSAGGASGVGSWVQRREGNHVVHACQVHTEPPARLALAVRPIGSIGAC
jgi:hypothetical protein